MDLVARPRHALLPRCVERMLGSNAAKVAVVSNKPARHLRAHLITERQKDRPARRGHLRHTLLLPEREQYRVSRTYQDPAPPGPLLL